VLVVRRAPGLGFVMQVDMFCNNVTYSVSGMARGVADYQHYTDQNVNCAAQGMAWVMVPSDQFYVVYGGYLSSLSGSGSTPTPTTTPTNTQFTEAQVVALQYLADNPPALNLSLQDGALIGSSILSVWAFAAGVRAIAGMFKGSFTSNESE